MSKSMWLYRSAVIALVLGAVFLFNNAGAPLAGLEPSTNVALDDDDNGKGKGKDKPKPKPPRGPKHDKDRPDDDDNGRPDDDDGDGDDDNGDGDDDNGDGDGDNGDGDGDNGDGDGDNGDGDEDDNGGRPGNGDGDDDRGRGRWFRWLGHLFGRSNSLASVEAIGISNVPEGAQPTRFYADAMDELQQPDAGADPGVTEARGALHEVLAGHATPGESRFELGLTSGDNQDANAAARALAQALRDLPSGPSGLTNAVQAYNAFIDASSLRYLADRAPELLAVQSFLDRLVQQSAPPDEPSR